MRTKISESIRFFALFNNSKKSGTPNHGGITGPEFDAAELKVLKEIQNEAPVTCEGTHIQKMHIIIDSDGLMRLQTRLTNRDDITDFKKPIILPKKHPLVFKLIMEAHFKNSHAGTQFLMAHLRE